VNETMCVKAPEPPGTNEISAWPNKAAPQQHHTNEFELVERLQRGDETAFREIVERYGSKIYRVAYGILRNSDDADETAQEVFTKVYFSIKSFGARSSLYAWIYRIAVNACYGVLRKKRFKLVHSNDCPEDASVRHALRRNLVNRLLARIPEDERWLLMLKEVEGFSIAELSMMTGLNENAIKVKLFRILQGLSAVARFLQ
jgi:RNA polymerase sigma-70 factor, ECF subfamily